MDAQVRDNAIQHCFEMAVGQDAIAAAYYRVDDGRLVLIHICGELYNEAFRLQRALDEAWEAGLIGRNACDPGWDCHVYLDQGVGAYVAGEETAQLESLEGKKAMPRVKLPFPAAAGLYGRPTTVNNVEALAEVPEILRRGTGWFTSLGRPGNSASKIFCIRGLVNRPCNVEEELGILLRKLIKRYAGGVPGGWDNLLAVIPGGGSMSLLPKSICNTVLMDFDRLRDVGSGRGAAAVIIATYQTRRGPKAA